MPAVRVIKKNRDSGTQVVLWDNRSGDFSDVEDGKWFTLCTDHATIGSHETRKLAAQFLSFPKAESWCECCAEQCTEFLWHDFECANCGAKGQLK